MKYWGMSKCSNAVDILACYSLQKSEKKKLSVCTL